MNGARVRVAAVVLLRGDGAALLQHRDDKPGLPHAGLWVPPGGHCDIEEPLDSCARREFREETGYECHELHWLRSYENLVVEGRAPIDLTIYWTRFDGQQELRCMEGQDLRFVERGEGNALPMPGYVVDLWDLALDAARAKGQLSSPTGREVM